MRKLVLAAVSAALLAVVCAPAPPAAANDDGLTLPGGGSSVTLGPNAVLRIDGRLRFTTDCDAEDGIADWGYAASDVYLVASPPADGDDLVDASGTPSTIVSPGSTFIDETVAITAPSGSTGEGTYSIVYDSCQDGVYQPDQDSLFRDAVTVVMPAELPPVDAAIAALKTDAQTAWGRWNQIGKLFDSLINVDAYAGCAELDAGDCLSLIALWADSPQVKEWAETAGEVLDQADCAGGDPSACFGLLADYWGFSSDAIRDKVFGGVRSLIANQAKSFFGLYADPPRADVATPSSASVDLPIPGIQGGGPVLDAVAELGTSLQRETALRTALITALERYQGAQSAGDTEAAAAQARSAAGLADALADASPVTAELAADVFTAVDDAIPDLDAITQRRQGTIQRQAVSGFTPAEDRHLRNAGIGPGGRAGYLDDQRAGAAGNISAVMMNLGPVGDLVAAQPGESARLRSAADQLVAMADQLAPSTSDVPAISVADPAAASVGSPVALAATASSGAVVTWDLDADGAFDDATGATANPTYRQSGHRVVAAKATAVGGASVTAHALVDVTAANAPPVIDAISPTDGAGGPAASGFVGRPFGLTAAAHDPTGEALTYAWFVDGEHVAGQSTATFTMTPTAADRGAHTIAVTVSDPHPGNLAQAAWRVRITDPDDDGDGWAANGVADCDDADGDVHPGRLEVLFNEVDDDCDPSTPDGGTDLGEGGTLWSWGQGIANPRGDNAVPGPVARDAGSIVQIASTFRTIWWLDRDGSVHGQGMNGNGNSGVGPTGDVFGIGSASGTLQGIAELTEGENSVYARTNDGRVVSWGEEQYFGTLGAGTTIYGRNYPDYVVGPDTDGDGDPDPLTDVTDVWQLGGAGLARTADGTLFQWGSRQCADAGWGARPVTPTAIPETALTEKLRTMVQADGSGNNTGSAIFRMADGSVLACGAERNGWSEYTFNRIIPFGSFGPDNPAVDVDANGHEWWVVTADGRVWVKTWDGAVNNIPTCTPALCPPGVLHELPLPDGWFVVKAEGGGDHHLVLADGRLVTFSGENTFGSLGHPVPDNPAPAGTPAPLNIEGYVTQSGAQVWNGYALVLPDGAAAEAGWVPPQPDVAVSATGASGPEGGTATAGIELSKAASHDVAVSWTFDGRTGTTTVPAGATQVAVPLDLPARDGVWGRDRQASFVLTGATASARLGDEIADIEVLDADPAPTVSLAPSVVPEGDGVRTGATVTLTLSGPAAVDLPFTVRSADGTATAGTDFAALDLSVVVPAGATTATAPLIVYGNTRPQPDRGLTLTAASGDGAIAPASAAVTIADDDPVAVAASATPVDGGAPLPVTLEALGLPAGETVQIQWSTRDLTATAPTDYEAASGTATLGGAVLRAASGAATITLTTRAAPAEGTAPQTRYLALRLTATAGGRTVLGPSTVVLAIRQAPGDVVTTTTTPTTTTTTSTTSTTSTTVPGSTTSTVPGSTTTTTSTTTTALPTTTSTSTPTTTTSTTTAPTTTSTTTSSTSTSSTSTSTTSTPTSTSVVGASTSLPGAVASGGASTGGGPDPGAGSGTLPRTGSGSTRPLAAAGLALLALGGVGLVLRRRVRLADPDR